MHTGNAERRDHRRWLRRLVLAPTVGLTVHAAFSLGLTGCAGNLRSVPAANTTALRAQTPDEPTAELPAKNDAAEPPAKKNTNDTGGVRWLWNKITGKSQEEHDKERAERDANNEKYGQGFGPIPAIKPFSKDQMAERREREKKREEEAKKQEDGLPFGLNDLWNKWTLPAIPEGETETLVLRGDQLETEKPLGKSSDLMTGAHEYYRQADYDRARKLFHAVAENKKNPVLVAEEARFYEAECLRREGKYPRACDTYHKMLQEFPGGGYREQACQRMYDIAMFWLEDTKDEMRQLEEKKDGKRWLVVSQVVHWEKEKPFIDQEGRALESLERVRYNDITGPLADKSLFWAGSVKFYRQDYREADHYFTQLAEMHPNSEFAAKAIELGIISKHLSTGGADYDGRKVAEARQLINTAMSSYPKLANDPDKKQFLLNQLACCSMQQAEKDYKMAEFYRRTRHPASAYFYYEIVRRRYPGTPFADQATQKMWDLRKELEGKAEASALPKTPEEAPTPGQPAPAAPRQPETAPPPRTLPPAGATPPVETAPQPRPFNPAPQAAPRPAAPTEGLPGMQPKTLPPGIR